MFYLIGIGLKPWHLTIEAKNAIQECEEVFLDTYTSRYSEGSIKDMEKETGKRVIPLQRKAIEEGFKDVLSGMKGKNIALLVFGNALSATTHLELVLEAKKIGIPCKVIPGISIYDFIARTGLDQYRFGRTATIAFSSENYEPESFYEVIESNFKNRLHTLCLLEIDAESNRMMSVSDGLDILEKIEKKRKKEIIEKATLIGLYGMGSKKEKVKRGRLPELKRSSYDAWPQSLVIASELNEKEKEYLQLID